MRVRPQWSKATVGEHPHPGAAATGRGSPPAAGRTCAAWRRPRLRPPTPTPAPASAGSSARRGLAWTVRPMQRAGPARTAHHRPRRSAPDAGNFKPAEDGTSSLLPIDRPSPAARRGRALRCERGRVHSAGGGWCRHVPVDLSVRARACRVVPSPRSVFAPGLLRQTARELLRHAVGLDAARPSLGPRATLDVRRTFAWLHAFRRLRIAWWSGGADAVVTAAESLFGCETRPTPAP